MRRSRWLVFGILLGAVVFTSACGFVNTFLGTSRSPGTVAELWSDVPRVDGLEKADLEMPLAAKLAIQAVTSGRINFIAFTTTRSPLEIQEYYTLERMQGAGWNATDMTGCVGDTGAENPAGAVCMFGKGSGGTREVLAVVIARDDSTQQTQVYFARIDASSEEAAQ